MALKTERPREKKRLMDFLNEFKTDGKIPVVKVQNWFKENKGVPIRTFQWYCTEGLIRAPKFTGRKGFYTIDEFHIISDILRVASAIKASNTVRLANLYTASKAYSGKAKLLDFLLNLIDNFPIYKADEQGEDFYYNSINDEVWLRVFRLLEKKAPLKNIRMLAIEKDIRKDRAKVGL